MYNVSGRPLWLGGCQLSDGSGITILQAVYAATDDYIVFARDVDPSVNGGVSTEYRFDFSLNNNGDLLELRCGDIVIDDVSYGSGFPSAEGVSLNLDPESYDAAANDSAESWCLSTEAYLADPEKVGTPGSAISACQ